MDLLDAIQHRRAVRDYLDVPVERDALHSVIAAATFAPSGMNRQPWSFVVVTDRESRHRWSDQAKQHLLASLSDNPHLAGYREHLESPAFNIFYNAPALIVICATEPDQMAMQDCCLAAENLMLAAHGRGLGTCWIGFAAPWLNLPQGKAELRIPAEHVPVAPIIIGHPRGEPAMPARRKPQVAWIEG